MQTIDREVLQHARDWLEGDRPWLCTIVKAVGSSPRPVGSVVAVTDDGRQIGSVSGGCVEGAVIEAAGTVIESGESTVLEFGVADEDAWAVGLACGGRVRILVERVA